MKHWLFIFALWGILAGAGDIQNTEPAEPEHYLLDPPAVEEIEEIKEEIEEEVTQILEDTEHEYYSAITKLDLSDKGFNDSKYAFVKDDSFYAIMLKEDGAGNVSSFLRAADIETGKTVGRDIKLNGDFKDAEVMAIKCCENDDFIVVVKSKDDEADNLFIERLSADGKTVLKTEIVDADGKSLSYEDFKDLSAGGGYSYVAVGSNVLVYDENLELTNQVELSHAPRLSVDSEGLAYFIESGDGTLYAYNPSIKRTLTDMPKVEGGNAVFNGDEDEVFVTDGKSFYVCDRLHKTANKLFDLSEMDISAHFFNDIYKDADGNFNFVFDTLIGRDYFADDASDVYYIARVTGVSAVEYTGEYIVDTEDFSLGRTDEGVIFSFAEDGLLYTVYSVEEKGRAAIILRKRDALTGEQIGKDTDLSKASQTLFTSKITTAGDNGYVILGMDYENNLIEDVIERVAPDGELIKKKNLSEIKGLDYKDIVVTSIQSDGTNTYIAYIPTSGDGSFLARTAILDEDFNFVGNMGEYSSYVCKGSDNLIYFIDSYNECLSAYNPKTKEFKENLAPFNYADAIYRGAEGELLVSEYDSLSRYDLATGKVYKLFDYDKIGIETAFTESVFRSSDGTINVIFEDYSDKESRIKIAHVKPAEEHPLESVSRKIGKLANDKGTYRMAEDRLSYKGDDVITSSVISVNSGVMCVRVTVESEDGGKKTYNDYFRTVDIATDEVIGEDIRVTDDIVNYNFWEMFRTKDGGFICIGDSYEGLNNYECIVRLSADGKVINEANLTELIKSLGNYSMVTGIKSNGVYTCIPIQGDESLGSRVMMLCLDANFNLKKVLANSYNVDAAFGNDKLIYVLDGINGNLYCYEPASDTIIDLKARLGNCFSMYAGGDDEFLIESGDGAILSYKPKEGTVTKLFEYEKVLGIDPYYLEDLSRDAYGFIHMVYIGTPGGADYEVAHIVRSGQ